MATIRNDTTGDALRRLLDDGSDLTKPMEIDFCVAIPTEFAGTRVAVEVRELGFKTKVDQFGETGEWSCYCTKSLIPEYSDFVKIEDQLDSIGRSYGGYADGFGSFGNAQKH